MITHGKPPFSHGETTGLYNYRYIPTIDIYTIPVTVCHSENHDSDPFFPHVLRQQFRDVGHHTNGVGEAKARMLRRHQTRAQGAAVDPLIDGRQLGMKHQTWLVV